MEPNIQNQDPDWEKCHEDWQRSRRRGKIFGGLILVTIGSLLLARHLGVEFPEWLFSWKVLLIVIGVFVGVKHNFRSFGWLIPVAIGGAFLLEDFVPDFHIGKLFWSVFIIIAGLFMIFKPRRRHEHWRRWEQKWQERRGAYTGGDTSVDDSLDSTSVFGGVKKNIISKNFKGGEVNCFFGGAVINLTQADINGRVELEVNAVFGGAKLIVPQHWVVQSADLVSVLGGIDDKRPIQNVQVNNDKVLVLKGTAVFGGIEILN